MNIPSHSVGGSIPARTTISQLEARAVSDPLRRDGIGLSCGWWRSADVSPLKMVDRYIYICIYICVYIYICIYVYIYIVWKMEEEWDHGGFSNQKEIDMPGWTNTSQWEDMLPHLANIASVLGSFSMNWVVPKERFLSRIINSSKNLVMRMHWISLFWISKGSYFDLDIESNPCVVSGFILIFVFHLYVTWQKTHMCLAPQWFVYFVCYNLNSATLIGLVAGKFSRARQFPSGKPMETPVKWVSQRPVITLPGIVPLFEPFRSFDSGAEDINSFPAVVFFFFFVTFLVTFPELLVPKHLIFCCQDLWKNTLRDRFWCSCSKVKRDQRFIFTSFLKVLKWFYASTENQLAKYAIRWRDSCLPICWLTKTPISYGTWDLIVGLLGCIPFWTNLCHIGVCVSHDIWVNYNELTTSSLEIIVCKGIIPKWP